MLDLMYSESIMGKAKRFINLLVICLLCMANQVDQVVCGHFLTVLLSGSYGAEQKRGFYRSSWKNAEIDNITYFYEFVGE